MEKMKLTYLCEPLEPCTGHGGDRDISGITCDSRLVKPGYLFIAVRGYTTDGHSFIGKAVEQGASAVVAEQPVPGCPVPVLVVSNARNAMAVLAKQFYGNPAEKMDIVGITGTNGKTTTAHFVESVFTRAGKSVGMTGTLEYRWPGFSLEAPQTTPNSIVLYEYLNKMAHDGVDVAVMEVSSHSLDQERVAGLDFSTAIFTNISHDHLDYHKSIENYVHTKKRLFSMLKPHGAAIINIDDPYAGEMAEPASGRVCFYGTGSGAAYRIESVVQKRLGSEFFLTGPDVKLRLTTVLPGLFNVYNAAAAAGAALDMGVDAEAVIEGIASMKRVPGRMEGYLAEKQDIRVIVDYAHTPDALDKVLRCAREFTHGRLIAVFGCGGDRDRQKRPVMGRTACSIADAVFITSDNPRTEDPDRIIHDIEAGLEKTAGKARSITDREEAIVSALKMAQRGDTVVIAGKGHETYQITGNQRTHFDDMEKVREYFEEVKRQ